MRIAAHVHNAGREHRVTVTTGGNAQNLAISAKASGSGFSVNGGEFLMLALATCNCNDVYREAARVKIAVDSVEVVAKADFEGIGLAATNITYRARIDSPAPRAEIDALRRQTDAVAEVHNTVRAGIAVSLRPWDDARP